MSEVQGTLFEPDFNRSIKVQTSQQRITSHAGAILLREVDHQLGLVQSIADQLGDPRQQHKIRYTATELLRERLYAMAMGYTAQDDLDRLAHDPAMRMATWNRKGEQVLHQRLASQPTHSRLIDWCSNDNNRNVLRNGLADWVLRHVRSVSRTSNRRVRYATVDIDSFPIEVHGDQQGGNYNGHYQNKVYHPIVASFSVNGDYDSTREGHRLGNGFIDAVLRDGQVHTANNACSFMCRVIDKVKQLAWNFDYRLDAGYTIGEVMDELCQNKVRFCGRLRKNAVLDRLAEPYLSRPPGRPPAEGYEDVFELGQYQAEGWKHSQRLILVVVDQPDPTTGQLNLLPRYFFLVTNWPESLRSGEQLLAHYRKRGTFEDRLGEFKSTVCSHLSSAEFDENEVSFLLSLLAFNLCAILRNELEDALGGCWDLERFQIFVLLAGARIVKGSRRLWLQVEQACCSFWTLLTERISRLKLPRQFSTSKIESRPWIPPPRHSHLSLVLRD